MSTLLREEEDSVGETNSSVPTHCRAENKVVTITLSSSSTTVPRQGNVCHRDPISEDQARTHRPRSSPKSSSGNCITTVDSKGQVIDLVKDQLPDMQLSEEDKRKNLELLQEAKEVSERFLTRRGRRSTSSISDSSTGIGPNPTPYTFPPLCRSGSITAAPQAAADVPEDSFVISSVAQDLRKLTELRSTRPCPAPPSSFPEGTLVPGVNADQRMTRASKKTDPGKVGSDGAREESSVHGRSSRTPDSKTSPMSVARPLPQGTVQRAPCTAEIKTMEAFPPLMRATSWDASGSSPEVEEAPPFVPELLECQESPVQSMKMEKLAKLREEHKLLRNQSIVGSKLPDLSETAELERGSSMDKEPRGQLEVMPNISDVMLHKLKLHRAQTGSAPPLTEREVENAFVQLSLAFRNDNYTLDTRLHQAERERGMTEDNMEKELEEFTGSFKRTAMLWQSLEHRESYQRLLEGVAVLHRLATRLSSRAEMVGAVRQEKRMNKATEVMMQYVENLKRTYEKDHTELMEFKKLANQNSGRGYGTSVDADEGVPRTSRSMSLTMGKALPRRRVSVAVVPKFNLVSIPGQTAVTARPVLPVLCEASSVKVCPPAGPVLQAAPADSGKTAAEQEMETSVPIKPSSPSEEICSEMKAKIEEEAYNRGYQEGLRKSKEMQELKEEEEEKAEESQKELVRKEEEDLEGITSSSSRFSGFLDIFGQLFPKVFRQKLFFWMALTLVATAFLAFAVFSYFGYHQRELSAGTSLASDKKNLLGWNSRPEEKNGSPE